MGSVILSQASEGHMILCHETIITMYILSTNELLGLLYYFGGLACVSYPLNTLAIFGDTM